MRLTSSGIDVGRVAGELAKRREVKDELFVRRRVLELLCLVARRLGDDASLALQASASAERRVQRARRESVGLTRRGVFKRTSERAAKRSGAAAERGRLIHRYARSSGGDLDGIPSSRLDRLDEVGAALDFAHEGVLLILV